MPFSAHEDHNLPLQKFESMLKTNEVYFFDSEDFQEIIHHYLDIGKVSLAKKALEISLLQHPASSELKLLKVEVLVFENHFDLAENMLEELQQLEVHNEEIIIQKANIYSKQDNHQRAIELLCQAISMTDDNADIYSLLGMEYLFVDDYVSAKNAFIQCLREDFEDYTALYNAIYCFDYLEDFDGAIEFLNNYLDRNPYCEVAWHQLGKQFVIKKMYKEALSSFDFAIYSDDTFIGAYLEKGRTLERLNRFNEAIENYKITLELDDPTSYAYLRIGKCHEQLGNEELAKKYYYKTVHEDPLLDKGWIAITDYYYRKKDYEKALHYINKAINIDSENVHYWKRCAKINELMFLYIEASYAYERTLELGNYELQTYISWTDLMLENYDYDVAVDYLLQALEFYPDHADIEYRLAGMYYKLDEQSKGEFYLKKALQHSFEEKDILEFLFPDIYNQNSVRNIISSFKKPSI